MDNDSLPTYVFAVEDEEEELLSRQQKKNGDMIWEGLWDSLIFDQTEIKYLHNMIVSFFVKRNLIYCMLSKIY